MGMLLGILFMLVTAVLLTLVANGLVQRLLLAMDQQSADRRYAHELVVNVVGIATFVLVTATFIGGNIYFDYAHW
jgi:hypothetical protein